MTNGNDFIAYISGEATANDNLGLTKREYFAVMAMQGILASWNRASMPEELGIDLMSKCSIQCADALITSLNKES